MIGVELTKHEASIYRSLREAGVFDMENGSIELHFSNGQLAKIDRHTFLRFKLYTQENG
jgi:hypothetical protein